MTTEQKSSFGFETEDDLRTYLLSLKSELEADTTSSKDDDESWILDLPEEKQAKLRKRMEGLKVGQNEVLEMVEKHIQNVSELYFFLLDMHSKIDGKQGDAFYSAVENIHDESVHKVNEIRYLLSHGLARPYWMEAFIQDYYHIQHYRRLREQD